MTLLRTILHCLVCLIMAVAFLFVFLVYELVTGTKRNILILLLAFSASAQNNTIWMFKTDFTTLPQGGSVIVTPSSTNTTIVNGNVIDLQARPYSFNGNTIVLTNVVYGSYNLNWGTGNFQFNVATNTTGSNNVVNLTGPPTAVYPPPYYLLNASSTLFVTLTNGPGIKFTPLYTNTINGLSNVVWQISTN